MGLRDDFSQYFDGNNLLAPNLIDPGVLSGSDNGILFLSEYIIMLKKHGLLTDQDSRFYSNKIESCIAYNLLNRVPVGQKSGLEGPDDILGVLNGCRELGNTGIPRNLLWGMIRYFGFLNNVNPGKITWSSFLARQPQIIAAMVNAAFPSFTNPAHWIARLTAVPFYFVAALSIGISCMKAPISDTDSRRLAWHLQNNTKKNSLMCRIASYFWMKRLYRDYPNGMAGVAELYYQPQGNNPYAKWWIT